MSCCSFFFFFVVWPDLCGVAQPHPAGHASAHLPVLHPGEQRGNPGADSEGVARQPPPENPFFSLLPSSVPMSRGLLRRCDVSAVASARRPARLGTRLWCVVLLSGCPDEPCGPQVWMALVSQAPQQYVVAASCPWMGAWLCLTMQPSHIPIDANMLLEVKTRFKVLTLALAVALTLILVLALVLALTLVLALALTQV